ncbi:MAG: RIO1 family regulatory kinase/ATPase [Halobacteriaceae archaeon]
MSIRELLRGRVEPERLERIAASVAGRFDEPVESVEPLEADNWLSTPCVVNERWFVKVLTQRNALVHALFTAGRNLGAFSSGTAGFFEHTADPLDMAERELAATRRMRELGIDAPEPIDAFEHDGLGVLALEYLPEFRTLGSLDPPTAERFAPDLFAALATLSADGLAHGDLRGENVLVHDGDLYFVDATTVRSDAGEATSAARAYDLACALAALSPLIGSDRAVAIATDHYQPDDLLAARSFLDFVNLRPDHDFDGAAVKGSIEQAVALDGTEESGD